MQSRVIVDFKQKKNNAEIFLQVKKSTYVLMSPGNKTKLTNCEI